MVVKFTDDAGCSEEAVDTGGPKREFLTLLMDHLKDRHIFDGPSIRKYLTCDMTGQYYLLFGIYSF